MAWAKRSAGARRPWRTRASMGSRIAALSPEGGPSLETARRKITTVEPSHAIDPLRLFMGPLALLGLASQHMKWLSVRQVAVSQNLANVNTPGFRAMDVRPFHDVLQRVKRIWRSRMPTISPKAP